MAKDFRGTELQDRIASENTEGYGMVEYGGTPIHFEGGDSFASNSPSETIPPIDSFREAVRAAKAADIRMTLVHGYEGGSVCSGFNCKCGKSCRSASGLRKHARAKHSVREYKK